MKIIPGSYLSVQPRTFHHQTSYSPCGGSWFCATVIRYRRGFCWTVPDLQDLLSTVLSRQKIYSLWVNWILVACIVIGLCTIFVPLYYCHWSLYIRVCSGTEYRYRYRGTRCHNSVSVSSSQNRGIAVLSKKSRFEISKQISCHILSKMALLYFLSAHGNL